MQVSSLVCGVFTNASSPIATLPLLRPVSCIASELRVMMTTTKTKTMPRAMASIAHPHCSLTIPPNNTTVSNPPALPRPFLHTQSMHCTAPHVRLCVCVSHAHDADAPACLSAGHLCQHPRLHVPPRARPFTRERRIGTRCDRRSGHVDGKEQQRKRQSRPMLTSVQWE